MEERELEGVLAHEVAHIRNRDVRLMTLVALLVGVIALLADILLRVAFYGGGKRSNPIITIVAFGALLLAPVAGIVIQLAVSRRREFLADASAAEITNDAEGMALALRKLQRDQSEIRNASRATAHMYIESPLNQASGLRGASFSRPLLDASAAREAHRRARGSRRLPARCRLAPRKPSGDDRCGDAAAVLEMGRGATTIKRDAVALGVRDTASRRRCDAEARIQNVRAGGLRTPRHRPIGPSHRGSASW